MRTGKFRTVRVMTSSFGHTCSRAVLAQVRVPEHISARHKESGGVGRAAGLRLRVASAHSLSKIAHCEEQGRKA